AIPLRLRQSPDLDLRRGGLRLSHGYLRVSTLRLGRHPLGAWPLASARQPRLRAVGRHPNHPADSLLPPAWAPAQQRRATLGLVWLARLTLDLGQRPDDRAGTNRLCISLLQLAPGYRGRARSTRKRPAWLVHEAGG